MTKAALRGPEELCEPGTHAWVIGRQLGEYCSQCGWSRAAYELQTNDLTRDSLGRYSAVQPVAHKVTDLGAVDEEDSASERQPPDTEPGP